MASDHLADWLTQWHDVRELVRVSAEVDAVHEIAAITDRLRTAQGGPARHSTADRRSAEL